MITLEALNALPVETFTATLGTIFEHSPWVAQRAASSRPFASRLDLLDAMRTAVREAPLQDQLSLIRAHPQLGARGRKRLELTEASSREQRRAGLDACSDEEFAELMRLNTAYVQKFDFPFILAVRGNDPDSILAFMRGRLNNDLEQERHTALTQIGLIGGYRLADMVASSAAAEVRAMHARVTRAQAVSEPLLREWMLAAGLDVRAGFAFTPPSATSSTSLPKGANTHSIAAASPTSAVPNACFLFGAYFDTATRTPRRDGSLSSLLGVAVAQDLRVRQRQIRFGLLVSPFPEGAQQGSILLDAALHEHTTLSAAEIEPLMPLRAADVTEHYLVISSPASTSACGALDVIALERATSALEYFLAQP